MQAPPNIEDLITLREASRLIPGRPHVSTLFRWIKQGKLQAWKVNQATCTTRDALQALIEPVQATGCRSRGAYDRGAILKAVGLGSTQLP